MTFLSSPAALYRPQGFITTLPRNVLYTEGAQYIAEQGGAYWLIDEIAFSQAEPAVAARNSRFGVWPADAAQSDTLGGILINEVIIVNEENGRVEGIDAKTGEFFAVTLPTTREQWRAYRFTYFSHLISEQEKIKIENQVIKNKNMLLKLIESFKNAKKIGQKIFIYFSNLHKNLFKDTNPQSTEYLASALALCAKPRDRYYEDVQNYEKLVEDFHNQELSCIKPEIIAELNAQIKNITDEPSPPKDDDDHQYSYSPSPGW